MLNAVFRFLLSCRSRFWCSMILSAIIVCTWAKPHVTYGFCSHYCPDRPKGTIVPTKAPARTARLHFLDPPSHHFPTIRPRLSLFASGYEGNPDVNNTSNGGSVMKFKDFDSFLQTYHDEPVMLCFTTSRCGPCKLMARELLQVQRAIGKDRIKIFSIDTAKWPQLSTRLRVEALPCTMLAQYGQIKLRIDGVRKADEIVSDIQSSLYVTTKWTKKTTNRSSATPPTTTDS